jgi:hypothetical protein
MFMHEFEDSIGSKPKHSFILKPLHHLTDSGRRNFGDHPGNVGCR